MADLEKSNKGRVTSQKGSASCENHPKISVEKETSNEKEKKETDENVLGKEEEGGEDDPLLKKDEIPLQIIMENSGAVNKTCQRDKIFKCLKEFIPYDPDGGMSVSDEKSLEEFREMIQSEEDNENLNDAFDLACVKGLHEHVSILLDQGVDPNNRSMSILEVAYYGYYKVLEVLLKDDRTDVTVVSQGNKETILHLILQRRADFDSPLKDYERCLDILLDIMDKEQTNRIRYELRRIINRQDMLGNTALHYAIMENWSEECILELLQEGADITVKNHWGDPAKVQHETLKIFLDDHIKSREGQRANDENFQLEFNYDFFVSSFPPELSAEEELEDSTPRRYYPPSEIRILKEMAENREYLDLLAHPLISSFIKLKWKGIRAIYLNNLLLYALFTLILTWYIFLNFGGHWFRSQTGQLWQWGFFVAISAIMGLHTIKEICQEFLMKRERNICLRILRLLLDISFLLSVSFLCAVICISVMTDPSRNDSIATSLILKNSLCALLTILFVRECIQCSTSFGRYVKNPSNWLEIALIGTVFKIIYNGTYKIEFEENRHLAAFSILLSWIDLVTMFCKNPTFHRLNIYVTMFYRVFRDFVYFLAWYSVFIVAFGLGFYLILHQDQDDMTNIKPVSDDKGIFNNTWLTLVKSSTMFVGEFEFGNIPFNPNSPFLPASYLFFLSFVFLIVVVLMNLLNGLAVGEISEIIQDAKLSSIVPIIESIYVFDSAMVVDSDFFLMRKIQQVCSTIFLRVFGSKVFLFYSVLPDRRLEIYPNVWHGSCFNLLNQRRVLTDTIINGAKEIALKKHQKNDEDLRTKMQDREIKERNFETKVETKIGNLETKMEAMETKLATILSLLTEIRRNQDVDRKPDP